MGQSESSHDCSKCFHINIPALVYSKKLAVYFSSFCIHFKWRGGRHRAWIVYTKFYVSLKDYWQFLFWVRDNLLVKGHIINIYNLGMGSIGL